MSELGNWKAGNGVLVSALVIGASLLGKKVVDKAGEKKQEKENVVVETRGYKVTKKK